MILGKIVAGKIGLGSTVFFGTKQTRDVKSLEMNYNKIRKAESGDYVGFNLMNIGRNDIKRGDLIGDKSNPPRKAL